MIDSFSRWIHQVYRCHNNCLAVLALPIFSYKVFSRKITSYTIEKEMLAARHLNDMTYVGNTIWRNLKKTAMGVDYHKTAWFVSINQNRYNVVIFYCKLDSL